MLLLAALGKRLLLFPLHEAHWKFNMVAEVPSNLQACSSSALEPSDAADFFARFIVL